jgi:hypothetical protein
MSTAFLFLNPEYGGRHAWGDVRCQACVDDFPHLCRAKGCPGLMHAHDRLVRGGTTILTSKCDTCGGHLAAA